MRLVRTHQGRHSQRMNKLAPFALALALVSCEMPLRSATLVGTAHARPVPSFVRPLSTEVLKSLPTEVQEEIENPRTSCREYGSKSMHSDDGSTYQPQITSGDDGHAAANQVGGQCWHSVETTLGPAIFDCDVLALDIAGFVETSPDGVKLAGFTVRAAEQPDSPSFSKLGPVQTVSPPLGRGGRVAVPRFALTAPMRRTNRHLRPNDRGAGTAHGCSFCNSCTLQRLVFRRRSFASAKGPPGKGSYGEVSISTDRSVYRASASAACDRRHKLASNTPLIFGRREIGSDATPHPRRWEERAATVEARRR
jgi:hypothetical protein